ncbi:helix-turn-helix transcriptional regulator [Pseudanabaena sp. FACHB-2040]|uniref:helix-turn-helix domain-containing protein n=1 Tax=Pseudanabaena sp. FACHB-2040 TaxID=2692859 RepID=UPI00168747B0|nr:helix-turn-helix transcriptional regulator [Pseudanabaena sp. FACHB-2040]MBD2258325.1 helix-turn-helix transcriptional regulator [Pseudanabaena sp. FACHB-2040]
MATSRKSPRSQKPTSKARKKASATDEAQTPPTLAGDRPVTNPDLFANSSTTPVASPLPIFEASKILTQRDHLPWKPDPDGKLCYAPDIGNGQGAIYFWVTENLEDEHPATLAGAAALAVIETFDIRAACMHLIFAAHATQVERPWEQELVISDRQIQAYLGLQQRTDKNRKEKLALIEEIAKQPCKITTYISWPRQGKSKGFTIEEGRLWHLLGTRYHYQYDLFGNQELVGMTFVVKAGLWAKYFLDDEDGQAVRPQQGILSKSLLKSVMGLWQHREGAARLMVWLLFKTQLSRQNALNVKTLMEVAYGPQRIQAAYEDYQLRKKLASTWDDDLLALHDKGWKIQFDGDTYPVEIRPISFGREEISRRPRGFFETLMDAYLWISPPEAWINHGLLPGEGAATDTLLEPTPEAEKDGLTGTEVHHLRTEKGWSQRKLAALTGLSQGLISMIENGTRSISPENEETLRQVFDYM